MNNVFMKINHIGPLQKNLATKVAFLQLSLESI